MYLIKQVSATFEIWKQIFSCIYFSWPKSLEKLNLEEDEKQKLLDLIDFNKLSADALQKAYEADIFPTNHVTKAALALCSKLRSQLDNAKEVIRTQETELNKFGLGGRGSLWLKTNDPGLSNAYHFYHLTIQKILMIF